VTRQALNNLVNGRAGISAEMAVRLAAAFGGGAEAWLRMQVNYELAQVKRREAEIVATVRGLERPKART
jgi:antitoxin HigA-1